MIVKNCKKCSFTPPKMKVLWLHIKQDHQYEFQCFYCNQRYKLKHSAEMHKREVHYKGTLVCFVCNEKVRSNKELKQHIQKRCKSSSPIQMVLTHYDNIHKEVEHKCPMRPKIANNQYHWPIILTQYTSLMRIRVTPVGKSLKTEGL